MRALEEPVPGPSDSVWSRLTSLLAWPAIAAGGLVPVIIVINKIDSQPVQQIIDMFM